MHYLLGGYQPEVGVGATNFAIALGWDGACFLFKIDERSAEGGPIAAAWRTRHHVVGRSSGRQAPAEGPWGRSACSSGACAIAGCPVGSTEEADVAVVPRASRPG